MTLKLKNKLKNDLFVEEINTPITEIIEENVYVDDKFIKNKEIVRIDMNLIQFPIFSKNTKRKVNQIVKYYFNTNRDTYISVTPQAGDYIPGETEEKVFIALMQIMKERNMPKKFIVLASELRDKLGLNKTTYNSIVSKSLTRLATTNYVFKNTLYSSEQQGVIGDKIETSIFNIRTITLSKKENFEYRELVDDKRIKVIYEIEFSDHFYKNIIQKGYMVYNGNTLLEIESSIARTIYMLVEKLRFDNLYLKLDTIFLIKRIPLKYEKKNIAQTMKTLVKSLEELVSKKLIVSYKLIKESTWEKSEIEILFSECANIYKQQRFYEDRNDFRKMLSDLTISNTEHNMVDEIEVIENKEDKKIVVTLEMIDKILGIMPSKARDLKTMPKTIKEAIEKYGYKKVKLVALYMKKNKVEKIRMYFLKALENNWVEDEIIIPKKIEKRSLEILDSIKKEPIHEFSEDLFLEFEKLEEKIKNGIESYVYMDYIKECGIETKIQQLTFKASRKSLICKYLRKYPEIIRGTSQEKKNSEVEEDDILNNILELKKYLNDYIENYSILMDLSLEKSERIKSIVTLKILKKYMTKDLTKEYIDNVLDYETQNN